ncbi:phosphotransferase enzyme family protein [Leifsonia sp. YAF41]|uniref:phosphotransferase enzyme family protein n=1 Tax=Leifsonia sp. YAF41 TaxID=3233086 RepID=UPI003F947E7A
MVFDQIAARETARAALSHFGIDDEAEITFVKYRENHVFRVAPADGAAVALRLHRPDYRSDREIENELEYICALKERGLPVVEIVPATSGALWSRVDCNGHSRRVSVQRWLEDAAPVGDVAAAFDGLDQTDAATFAQIGRLLGTVHNDSEALGRPAGFERAPWDLDGLTGNQPLWGDPTQLRTLNDAERAILRSAVARVRAELATLSVDAHHYGVIHADLTPENILRDADGLVIIDFDDFGEGWYLFDLATILFFYTHHPRFEEYRSALLDGYNAVRELTAAELAAWDAMLLARAFTYLGWASDRPGDEAADHIETDVAPWVVHCASVYLAGEPLPWGRP